MAFTLTSLPRSLLNYMDGYLNHIDLARYRQLRPNWLPDHIRQFSQDWLAEEALALRVCQSMLGQKLAVTPGVYTLVLQRMAPHNISSTLSFRDLCSTFYDAEAYLCLCVGLRLPCHLANVMLEASWAKLLRSRIDLLCSHLVASKYVGSAKPILKTIIWALDEEQLDSEWLAYQMQQQQLTDLQPDLANLILACSSTINLQQFRAKHLYLALVRLGDTEGLKYMLRQKVSLLGFNRSIDVTELLLSIDDSLPAGGYYTVYCKLFAAIYDQQRIATTLGQV